MLLGLQHLLLKRSLLVIVSDLQILNPYLKLTDPTYCFLQLEHIIKEITLQLSHDKLPLMKYVFSVTLHINFYL